jgi:hypothetical protein
MEPNENPATQAADAEIDKAPDGMIDIDSIKAKIDIPPEFKSKYDAIVLSGMRIMFDKRSHKEMFLSQLDKPGPMAKKIGDGIVALMYMLWQQSNQTLPPQLIVPTTFCLTLEAFDFLQKSGEPEATKEVLGEAVDISTSTIMQKFGVDEAQLEQVAQQQRGAVQQAPDAGMLGDEQ